GNLRLSVKEILTLFSLLIPAFSLQSAPPVLTIRLRSPLNALLPRSPKGPSAASVIRLAPVHFRRRVTRPVSYYALFQWWLLLSQHPGCLGNSTSFSTYRILWDLSWWSGLFPSRL